MKKLFLSLCAILLVSCSFSVKYTKPDTKRDYRDSVERVALHIDDKPVLVATVFAVDENTLVSVNHFCLKAVEGVIFNEGEIKVGDKVAEVLDVHPSKDVCLLRSPDHGLKPLPLTTKRYPVRSPVTIIGVPMGVVKGHYTGEITGYDTIIDVPVLKDKIIVSVPTVGGISGSPCIVEGQVIGILVMGVPRFPHLSFCEPTKYLFEIL